ncbi:MAG: TonB family protein [Alphaproteobacteria bacterium]|nr:TonB family protein [Alphaproteobacteria bacterium]MCB9794452.1 TonB family protein [Alphaproteobacteria bacterium]
MWLPLLLGLLGVARADEPAPETVDNEAPSERAVGGVIGEVRPARSAQLTEASLTELGLERPRSPATAAEPEVCWVEVSRGSEEAEASYRITQCEAPYLEATEAAARAWLPVVCGEGEDPTPCTFSTFVRFSGDEVRLPEADYRAVHWSEIRVKRQVTPQMPEAAKALMLVGQCQVRFFVDTRGRPTAIKVEECSEVFEASTLEAAEGWRFHPLVVDGERVPFQCLLTVRYKQR